MRMNGTTKNDLSFNQVKIDYAAMLDTASIAIGGQIWAIERNFGDFRNATEKGDLTLIHLSAQRLAEEAGKMAIVADMYAALKGGMEREEIEIINK
jgi:hypothetical protein